MVDELHEKTKIRVMKPQGTYLLCWVKESMVDDELHAKIHDQAKFDLNRGTGFGKEGTCMLASMGSPFHPHWKKSPNACGNFSQQVSTFCEHDKIDSNM